MAHREKPDEFSRDSEEGPVHTDVLSAKVVTVSDGVVAGTRDDKSGEALYLSLVAHGYDVIERRVVADGIESVAECLTDMTNGFAGLVVTTGGTGFTERDLTPRSDDTGTRTGGSWHC